MIRPFSLRDLALVRRLSERGTLMHAESALTNSCQPLRGALFSLVGSGDAVTLVWRADDGDAAGFVQLLMGEDEVHPRLVCLGIESDSEGNGENIDEDAWLALLDDVVVAVGQRGAHSLLAEVDELGPELPILRRAGFAIYTRQDIWLLVPGIPMPEKRAELMRWQPTDEWDVEWLYANTVPPLIQVVEPSPPNEGEIWVLRESGELTSFVHLHETDDAAWMQFFIHPNAYVHVDEIVTASVVDCLTRPDKPVYCSVRRYQSWVQGALADLGFVLQESQAVMVKHLASPITSRAGSLERLLGAQSVRPTTLLQRYRADSGE